MTGKGFEPGDDRNAIFLNRVRCLDLSEEPNAILSETDARHARSMIHGLGLENATGTETLAEHRSADSWPKLLTDDEHM